MTTRMLIDARHPEETRVAVLKGNRIEEFDFESAEHKQIKGNIYLAKVTRVEPSLQAAFVDFGGNRHGFLAFSEIHPDYYQIPKVDRDALLAEEQAHAEEEARLRAEEDGDDRPFDGDDDDERGLDADDDESSEALAEELAGDGFEEVDTENDEVATIEGGSVSDDDDDDSAGEDSGGEDRWGGDRKSGQRRGRGRQQGGGRARASDEARAKRLALRRRYKIQDVIQRRQVLLVQVVKEERGNKGAALTTYLSLAGRYCVLMPNSGHGGGISRKISSAADRKRLKQIVSDLSLPKTMGLIVRTAGLSRTKTEIKRDFDYLARLWDEIRENTMGSTAPAVIHSDSDLVKRAIRDIYSREIEEVFVEGADGYRAAKQFMKLLMPSHARRVKQYADPVPLFQRYGAEDQLSAMYDPVVQLKSGGYLVINPTEALVSIDINSGRSTKQHGIEQTALSTNLEAAREIARQLRLRDMAGLVVIDFIDMENNSSIRKVEKCMKDALKNDRARIQVGRISGFGLMEMSRQRLRTGVLEATTRECPHCDGTGLVRTASSAGLSALRLIEDEAAKGKGSLITLFASTEAAVYLLNAKRADLTEIEARYGVTVAVSPEGEEEGAKMRVTSSGPRPESTPKFETLVEDEDEPETDLEDEDEGESETDTRNEDDGGDRRGKRRRRGGRRNRGKGDGDTRDGDREESDGDADEETGGDGEKRVGTDEDSEDSPRKRRRRRRGGRGRNRGNGGSEGEGDAAASSGEDTADRPEIALEPAATIETNEAVAEAEAGGAEAERSAKSEGDPTPKRSRSRRKPAVKDDVGEAEAAGDGEEKPPRPRRARRKKDDAVAPAEGDASGEAEDAAPAESARKAAAKEDRSKRAASASKDVSGETETGDTPAEQAAEAGNAPANDRDGGGSEAANDARHDEDEESGPPRRGWWQRTFGN